MCLCIYTSCTCVCAWIFMENFATLELHLRLSAKLRIWQVSACEMEPQSGTIIPASQPASSLPTLFFQCCAVFPSKLFSPSTKYCGVPPSQYMFFSSQLFPPSRKYDSLIALNTLKLTRSDPTPAKLD